MKWFRMSRPPHKASSEPAVPPEPLNDVDMGADENGPIDTLTDDDHEMVRRIKPVQFGASRLATLYITPSERNLYLSALNGLDGGTPELPLWSEPAPELPALTIDPTPIPEPSVEYPITPRSLDTPATPRARTRRATPNSCAALLTLEGDAILRFAGFPAQALLEVDDALKLWHLGVANRSEGADVLQERVNLRDSSHIVWRVEMRGKVWRLKGNQELESIRFLLSIFTTLGKHGWFVAGPIQAATKTESHSLLFNYRANRRPPVFFAVTIPLPDRVSLVSTPQRLQEQIVDAVRGAILTSAATHVDFPKSDKVKLEGPVHPGVYRFWIGGLRRWPAGNVKRDLVTKLQPTLILSIIETLSRLHFDFTASVPLFPRTPGRDVLIFSSTAASGLTVRDTFVPTSMYMSNPANPHLLDTIPANPQPPIAETVQRPSTADQTATIKTNRARHSEGVHEADRHATIKPRAATATGNYRPPQPDIGDDSSQTKPNGTTTPATTTPAKAQDTGFALVYDRVSVTTRRSNGSLASHASFATGYTATGHRDRRDSRESRHHRDRLDSTRDRERRREKRDRHVSAPVVPHDRLSIGPRPSYEDITPTKSTFGPRQSLDAARSPSYVSSQPYRSRTSSHASQASLASHHPSQVGQASHPPPSQSQSARVPTVPSTHSSAPAASARTSSLRVTPSPVPPRLSEPSQASRPSMESAYSGYTTATGRSSEREEAALNPPPRGTASEYERDLVRDHRRSDKDKPKKLVKENKAKHAKQDQATSTAPTPAPTPAAHSYDPYAPPTSTPYRSTSPPPKSPRSPARLLRASGSAGDRNPSFIAANISSFGSLGLNRHSMLSTIESETSTASSRPPGVGSTRTRVNVSRA